MGYGVWLLMGVVIAIPEIWAGVGTPPWPTISATVGHLEARWNWVAIIVVALIVVVATRAASYVQPQTDEVVTPAGGQGQRRTETGRLAMSPDEVSEASEMWAIVYFVIATSPSSSPACLLPVGPVTNGSWPTSSMA